ncbi:translation elongation factor Ts [Kordiimonas sp. SCSIO 12610]|uniref:translation elongation factor Ts n=1 Tax=Kordiimonas sp. SCSIO 12610 TaxID=2829597 RepID=UPI00210D0482|nr:translation elongation factor Ts [Kordiimonas sp. SCSIO 12610]UTW54055.1 elongation factor Ts [Kordiimonas sp. SCSIO 12610]
MAQITAALVKDLREKSGAGMMDCKKALAESDGNVEAAMDWLRTKGLSAAAKKSGRVAAEGLVGFKVEGTKGAVIEVNSETDFVARNEQFQGFVGGLTDVVMTTGTDVEAIKAASFPGSDKTVADTLTDNIATIGENMNIRRAEIIEVENGIVASYLHGAAADNMGKIAVLVGLTSEAGEDVLAPLGKQLAMHIAAANPASLNIEALDPALVEREKQVQIDKARESGKPENIIEKMIVGRMRKYYEEVVLLEQVFVIDGETKIAKVIEKAAKDAGTAIELTGFVRMEMGDGLEKKEEDFAAEVAAVAGA